MIVQQLLLFQVVFYRQILLAAAQELFLADALAHAPHHLLVRLKELLDFTAIEKACADYRHSTGPGCPATYSLALLVRAILVAWLFGLSLRQLEERLHSDLIARWFVGCQPGDPVPDHSTLGRFEGWFVSQHPDLYFSQLLSQIDHLFPQERQAVQIGDTYAMIAPVADEGLVGRLRHVCLRLTMELQDCLAGQFETYLQGFAWASLFGPKPEPPLERLDPTARAQRLERTVLAALDFRQRVGQLLAVYPSQEFPLLRTWCQYLDKVIADEVQVDRNADQSPSQVTELAPQKKGAYRLVSATDPEASVRLHGDAEKLAVGYNIQVAATVQGFIRETQAYTGATPDQAGIAALINAQKKRQTAAGEPLQLPPKLIYDQAAGTGKTQAEVRSASDGQTQLVAKVSRSLPAGAGLGPYDFRLAADGHALTCPHGQVSRVAFRNSNGEGRCFQFYAWQCWPGEGADPSQRCSLWERCRRTRLGPRAVRQVFISDYRDQVLQAEAYNQTESFKQEMKQRPSIERVIFELTHYTGARYCRRRGLQAADYQAKMCATAYNLKVLVRRLSRSPKGRKAA